MSAVTLADVVGVLYLPGEHVAVCTKMPGGRFTARVLPLEEIGTYELPQDRNVYFGANPVVATMRGRGSHGDVTRWAALYADLDVKPGALPTMKAAAAVVDALTTIIGTPPTFVIASGHGLLPLWQIDPDDPDADLTDPGNRTCAHAHMVRWGRLVERVSRDFGAEKVDHVFDLPRVLRAPGTVNHKDTPVPATATAGGGRPLTVAEVAELLDSCVPEGGTERPEPDGPNVAHPSYDSMTPEEKDAMDRYLAGTVRRIGEELGEIATWRAGQRDERGRGWQKIIADVANRFGQLARAEWTSWSYEDAHEALVDVVPADMARDVPLEVTWTAQRGRRAPARFPASLSDPPAGSVDAASSATPAAPGTSGGSGGSGASDASEGPPVHRGIELPEEVCEDGAALLNEVRAWLARHIIVMTDGDLDILTLWAAHTHLSRELYTTPRLQIDSPVPESGKTTVLEHLERLSYKAVMASSISSPALLARLVGNDPRTLLLDEVDRTLDPKKEGVGELLAILNSGYKVGGRRPTLMPAKGGGWEAVELSTFAPVVMAGNQPVLPDDTRTRIIRVLLLPDWEGRAEESDWEIKEEPASILGARLARWARHVTADVAHRPVMPPGCKSRFREKWQPLARVAHAAGERWLDVVLELAADDVEQVRRDREEGLAVEKPAVLLVRHILASWPDRQRFWRTTELVDALILDHPEVWGTESAYGRTLTAQRLGRMLANNYSIRSTTRDSADKNSPRGYRLAQFEATEAALRPRSANPTASTI